MDVLKSGLFQQYTILFPIAVTTLSHTSQILCWSIFLVSPNKDKNTAVRFSVSSSLHLLIYNAMQMFIVRRITVHISVPFVDHNIASFYCNFLIIIPLKSPLKNVWKYKFSKTNCKITSRTSHYFKNVLLQRRRSNKREQRVIT